MKPAEVADGPGEREKNIVTTEEETRCFEMIERWIREVNPDAVVVPRDSQMYFAVNLGNVRTWFVRFNVQTAPYWIAFRHVSPEELKSLAPGAETCGNAGFGDSRAALDNANEVSKFRTALITAYMRQASKIVSDAEQSGTLAAT